jgi:hypothetical protein
VSAELRPGPRGAQDRLRHHPRLQLRHRCCRLPGALAQYRLERAWGPLTLPSRVKLAAAARWKQLDQQ